MNLINALILGIVEGITEFLPISSTAHLIVASKLLHIPQTDYQKFFEVFIQSGAILAVVVIYYQYLLQHKELFKKLVFSFVPTAIVGLLLYKIIKDVFFESYYLIIAALFLVGVVFLLLEQRIKNNKLKLEKSLLGLGVIEAVVIGLGQSLAVIPGVSRSGIVIVVTMLLHYKRDEAATYSFLLAVPTILAASLYDLYKMREMVFGFQDNTVYLLVGFIASLVTAYVSIKWLITYLKNNSLVIFGIYRILLAIILLQLL
jgi:undecaprenyl-diphosphatase